MKTTATMKAIDTNVLVRIFVKDNLSQSKRALEYIKANHPIFISYLVLCEFSWVFKDCYKFTKNQLLEAIEDILKTNQFVIESSELVWSAVHEYKEQNSDFSDCLIGVIAKYHGSIKVGTFDKKACNSKLFELI